MINKNWLFAKASIIGKQHIEDNLPCQDSHKLELIDENGWGIAVVSDGAGACKHADIGSQKVVEFGFSHFNFVVKEKGWATLNTFPLKEEWQEIAESGFKIIFDDIRLFAENQNYNYRDLGATVIVVVFSPNGLLIAHIGDGRAGYLDKEGEWKAIMNPYKGEEANTTVFITSNRIWENTNLSDYIKTNVIQDEIMAFTLMTDGCENATFEIVVENEITKENEYKNKPFANFFNPHIEALKTRLKELNQEEIDMLWGNYLIAGTSALERESDDKTLILAVKS